MSDLTIDTYPIELDTTPKMSHENGNGNGNNKNKNNDNNDVSTAVPKTWNDNNVTNVTNGTIPMINISEEIIIDEENEESTIEDRIIVELSTPNKLQSVSTSLSSSTSSVYEKPPTSLQKEIICEETFLEDNEINDDLSDEFELSNTPRKIEQRRSSKRAMSSSNENDEMFKFKSRIKLNSPNKLEFNPFINQFDNFINHKSLPSLIYCKLLSIDEVINYLNQTYNRKLPEVEKVFPWLHGIHKHNYGQISFLSNTLYPTNDKPKIITFEKPASSNNINPLDDLDEKINTEGEEGTFEEEDDDVNKLMQTPDVRFLIPIRSCNSNGEASSEFTNIITESCGFIRGSIIPEDILIPYSSIINLEGYLQKNLPRIVFEQYHIETIITDCIITHLIPVFRDVDPVVGINLRNFHIQVSKISHVSDFIVYCFNKEDHKFNMDIEDKDFFINNKCKCVSLSRLLHIAQLAYQYQHKEILKPYTNKKLLNDKKYNTFILRENDINKLDESNVICIPILSENSSNKIQNELCSNYDINVFNNWDSNYLYRERLEISKMSTATPIKGSIWIGNITDYECLQIQLNNQNIRDIISDEEVGNMLNNQQKCPIYCNEDNTIVRLRKNDFRECNGDSNKLDELLITKPKKIWRMYIKCIEESRIPTLKQLKIIYENYLECDYINIEFPPSGSLTMADMSDDEILSIINICKFCYYICDDNFPCLIYCSDGYTESSLLILCYLMYSEKISLDESILKLHKDYGRPFFIFKTDYLLLQKLEIIMNKFSPLNKNDDDEIETRESFKFEEDKRMLRSLLLLMPKGKNIGTVGGNNQSSFITPTGHHIVQLRGNNNNNNNNKNVVGNTFGKSSMFSGNSVKVNNTKIMETSKSIFEEVSGSLPSRILKHLYLGSLNHAESLIMLNKLGIEYIVSVGENVNWIEKFKYNKNIKDNGNIEYEFNDKNLNIKKLLIINELSDDGMSTITLSLKNSLELINECYEKDSKILVHCQVGVSRSATVCICEVMKRLNLSICRAYLFVRVRRLNVIIQPNLKLMYELNKWEENFNKREVEWYVLCREIYNLNRSYIK